MMSAKTIAAPLPNFTEAPPLVRNLRRAVRWLMGRFIPAARTAERALAVEDRVTIGPKKSLVVVRCRGQRFLVAAAGDTIGPIIEIAGEVAGEIAAPKSSATRARRVRRERGA